MAGEGQKRAPKNSTFVIEERRRRVFELLMAGVPEVKIAELVGVHRNTIINDVRAIREANRERVSAVDPYAEIGDHDSFLREVEKQALYEYRALHDEKIEVVIDDPTAPGMKRTERRITRSQAAHRQKFLEIAMRARQTRMEYQLKTGIVPKVPEQVDMGLFQVEGVDIRKISPEAARALRDKLARKMLAQAASSGGLPTEGFQVGDSGDPEKG